MRAPCLTILYHPDLSRIGDRAVLASLLQGKDAQLSRTEPRFVAPRSLHGQGLEERHVSRKPLRLQATSTGGVTMIRDMSRTAVVVNGETVGESRSFTAFEIQRGVVLELSKRVVLLLHTYIPSSAPDVDDLGILGESSAMARVRTEIRNVAHSAAPVLIRGQTGTGKELVANAIHTQSVRREQPMVSIRLGSDTGSFAGPAHLRSAHESTLFVDRIEEASPELQAMLFKLLETGAVQSGSAGNAHRVDIRVIATTAADLDIRIMSGRFYGPLYQLLASHEIRVPPLYERRDDIARLVVHFLRIECKRIGESDRLDSSYGQGQPWLTAQLMVKLIRYNWPGNVIELRHVIQQLVVGSRGLPTIILNQQLAQRLGVSLSGVGQASGQPAEPEPIDSGHDTLA